MPKNILKIPPKILDRIKSFSQDDVVAACVKLLTPEDVHRYAKLGVHFTDGRVVTPPPAVPSRTAGRFSRANAEGMEKVRYDLPKIWKDIVTEMPNWGDWSKGSHDVVRSIETYQREFYPPKNVELTIDVIQEARGVFTVKFAVNQVLSRRSPNFERELFYNLNILQENVGSADVFPSAATLAEYTATVSVAWQILPPGTVDEVIRSMLQGKRGVTPDQENVMKGRLSVLEKLKPEAYIAGSDAFLRYFGAKFGDDFVVFENLQYGNALYVMHESWPELSRRSRVELLAGPRDSFERIEHRDGWKERLTGMVTRYRWERRKKG